jgi:hypothetical protein
LEPTDATTGTFSVFIRKNAVFDENFSVGLVYRSSDGRGEVILLRCNGKHGTYNFNSDPNHPHYDFHVHKASETAIEAGERAEKHAVKTTEFASYREAVQYFVKTVNINQVNAAKHFPSEVQTRLFGDEQP